MEDNEKDAEIIRLREIVERAQAIISTSTYPNWHEAARALASAPAPHLTGRDAFREALEEIVNPIAAMQRKAEAEGAKIDGMMANALSRNPEYLKGIASAALAAERSDNG